MNFWLKKDRCFLFIQKLVVSFLVVVFLFSDIGNFFLFPPIPEAKAAETTIDNAVGPTGTSHHQTSGQTVFIDDQTGYKFYRDSGLTCVYSKTTDGGATWGGAVTVDSQADCIQVQIWYDRWTPGDNGTYIHIVTMDSGNDDIWYNRLDTSGDTLLLGTNPVSMLTGTAQNGTSLTEGENFTSITKATNGVIYAVSNDGSGVNDSFIIECSASCNLAASWTETTPLPLDVASDQNILVPLPSGDIMIIQRDIDANAMRSQVWDDSAGTWDGVWTTIDAVAPENATYDIGFSATVSSLTGDVYLAYIAANTVLGNDDQIRTAVYSGGSWSTKKQAIRFTERGINNVSIALDKANDNVYVAYSVTTIPATVLTANVYWRYSTDDMATWSYEKGPVNNSPDDVYGVDLNRVSDERIYVSWFDNTDDDIYGETIADIFPGIHVTAEESELMNSLDSYSQSTIDNAVGPTGTSHIQTGGQTVFIDDQTGYKFYRDSGLTCVYSKTTDGGASWGTPVTVDAQADCNQITVWYDRWTPGDNGTYIYIATMDIGNDDIWFNRLDTNGDTLLLGSSPVSMLTGSAQGGTTLLEGENFTSITKTRNGVLYAVSNDGSSTNDSFVVFCAANCQTNTSWQERTPLPLDVASDQNILVPVGTSSVMIINRDIDQDDIRTRVWQQGGAAWSSWTTVDSNAPENVTHDVGMSATLSPSGDVYLAYIANNTALGTDDQIRSAVYSNGSWTNTTNVLTGTVMGLTSVSIALDTNNNDIYVAYSAQATANTALTANVLWKRSTDDMTSWSAENGPVNATPDDIYGVDLNRVSSDRVHVTWFDNTDDDIYGVTLADLPLATPDSTGEQQPMISADTTNVYIGGVFALYNTDTQNSLNVTGVTISETGTIDAATDITNIKLLYEMDNAAPFDCVSVSYDGSESQFGSTDNNGFSGDDGVAAFSGTSIGIDENTALCIYPVMDVLDSANSSSTIEISIANPSTDVSVTGSTAKPNSAQNIPGSTLVFNDGPALMHYHWRHDNGSEITATSKTGGVEDTPLTAMAQSSTTRLRILVSNEGSSPTPSIAYRLEYASNPSTCDMATGWTDVGDSGGDFDMADSVNLTEGGDTTPISIGTGGVTDENTTFLTPNGGVHDTNSQTGGISLNITEFVELEYSIVAAPSTSPGNTYCFRVTNQGTPIATYDQYPRANIASDVFVSIATSTQYSTTSIPMNDYYVGSAFVVTENTSSRNVTRITIAETGSIDAAADLDNIELYYDLDNTAPYDCAGETYDGSETQFGSTDSDGFSSANGTSTFIGSATITTTSTMCLYTVLDVASGAQNGETINIMMENPSANLLVTGLGSVGPTITRDLNASTTLIGAILTQSQYHWRHDNGDETAATSQTSETENININNISQNTPVRLRLEVSNEGPVVSEAAAMRLEYGTKITTCSAVSSWTDVGASGGAFDMFDSIHITDGTDTTDIANNLGGVTNTNSNFITPNEAIKDTASQVATTTFATDDFLEAEFSIKQTTNAAYDTSYCFRLSNAGTAINDYVNYPELRTSPERDFEIQRGTATFSTVSHTLTAGVDYIAPSSSSSAFVRITNSHYTGAGDNSLGGTQNADDVTVYISNPSNIMNSFTLTRPATAIATSTRVSWEIVEFIGSPGSDNEMIVRGQGAVTYGTTALTATGTAVSGIVDDSDVVVFITGQFNPDTGTADYNTVQSVSSWLAGSDQPAFRRGEASADAVRVSYAVVEFTGINWKVQRAEHTYALAGTTETESIAPVNSLSRTFLHTQKRIGAGLPGEDEFGHEVWLSSIGAVSFYLEPTATTPAGQTSVAWIIENTQTSSGAMNVTRSSGFTTGGAEPLTLSVSIGTTLSDITNASIFTNTRGAGTGTLYPRPIAGITIASTTHYQIWRSDTGTRLDYRTEVVEWPTAGLAFQQNRYWFFADNNALLPTDPWPAGVVDLGENAVLTGSDEPLGDGEHIRIRMSLQVNNATFPEQSKSFKLQYGERVSTCGAIAEENWSDVGAIGSGATWRGYDALSVTDGTLLSIDPPTGGDLLLSLSDVAGTYEEANNTAINAYSVEENDEMEFDWHIEQNGAAAETFYCFRMVESSGTVLGGYDDWPQLRTSSFTATTQNWRWYSDINNETPTSSMAGENVSPIDVANGSTTKLRITVKETENIARDDVRFKLQYSEYANFAEAHDILATSSCIASSTWCYEDGGGTDNAVINSKVLSDADACSVGAGEGCGTHNEDSDPAPGFRHEGNAAAEYEYTIKANVIRPNAVYYFRLYDIAQDIPVVTNTGETYPSLVAIGPSLVYTSEGIASGVETEGVTTDVETTMNSIAFGSLPLDTNYEAAHRFTVETNATEGYQILVFTRDDLRNLYGNSIPNVAGTNLAPASWNGGCTVLFSGCFGYHTGDDILSGGSTRFAPNDSFASFSSTTPQEVFHSPIPTNESFDMIYRIRIGATQQSGEYQTSIVYLAIPIF